MIKDGLTEFEGLCRAARNWRMIIKPRGVPAVTRHPLWEPARKILLEDFGLYGFGVPVDEYDADLPEILELLDARAGVEDVMAYLDDLHFEGYPPPETSLEVATKLCALVNRDV